MSKPVVLLDMDGVISDFHSEYTRLSPSVFTEKKFHSLVLDHKIFETLPKMPNADKLLNLLFSDLDVQVCILTSMGTWNPEVAAAAKEQKQNWLEEHGIVTPQLFVNTWAHKYKHGTSKTIMIDDREDVYQSFIERGMQSVHYIDRDWINMEARIRRAVTSINKNEDWNAHLHL